jgi:hypothetical protein
VATQSTPTRAGLVHRYEQQLPVGVHAVGEQFVCLLGRLPAGFVGWQPTCLGDVRRVVLDEAVAERRVLGLGHRP